MKKLLTLSLLSLFASGSVLAAQEETTPQQEKMKACNAKAGDMKGDERKAFMKTCLSAKKPESKMAMCNKKTAGLKGDERSKAQSECMKAA